jgi:hypothetical protein
MSEITDSQGNVFTSGAMETDLTEALNGALDTRLASVRHTSLNGEFIIRVPEGRAQALVELLYASEEYREAAREAGFLV